MIQEVADQTQVRILLDNDVYLVGSQLEQIKEGEFYYIFPDDTKQYAGIYVNGQKQGIWQDYKGDQLFTSIYEKGIRNPFLGTIDYRNRQGFWTEIDGEYDELIHQGNYKDNIRVGTWNVYNWGKLVGKGDYNEHGIKVGEWIEPSYKFTMKRVFFFGENGQKTGYWATNLDGEQVYIQSSPYQSSKLIQKLQLKKMNSNYLSGGGHYNQYGLKEGDWTEFYENYNAEKFIQKGAYLDGLPFGKWKIIYKNHIIGGEQGLKHGKWTEFLIQKYDYQWNIRFQGQYDHGLRIGEWEIKIKNNFFICNYNFQGQKQGLWFEPDKNIYYITHTGEYNSDLRIGEWKSFDNIEIMQDNRISQWRYTSISIYIQINDIFYIFNSNFQDYEDELSNIYHFGLLKFANLALLNEILSIIQIYLNYIYNQNGQKQDKWIETTQSSCDYFGRYKNGIRIGKWQYKFEDTIMGGGSYDEYGVKKGKWQECDEEASITESGIYKNGLRQGKWKIKKSRYAKSLVVANYDKKGMKQGKWTEMNYKDFIEYGHYRNGIRTGKWQSAEKIICFEGEYDNNGVKQGLWKDPNHFPQGHINISNYGTSFGQYINGIRVGEWKIIRGDIIIGNCNYNEKGALDGVVNLHEEKFSLQYCYENGFLNKVKVSSQFEYQIDGCYNSRNQKDGIWVDIFEGKKFCGQYSDGKKIGLFWKISDSGKKIGYQNYDINGLKQGDSIEPSDNYYGYDEQNEITYHRFYQNDIRVGNCKIMFKGYQIGGGNYDDDGNKQGIWKETKDIYNYSRQIIYQGEYKDNIRVGQWIILFKGRKIGGGIYDEKGLEQGLWHEVDISFDNWNKKIENGRYKNGKKIGEWIIYENGVIYDKKIFDDEGNEFLE